MSRVSDALNAVTTEMQGRTKCRTCAFIDSLKLKAERAEVEQIVASDLSHALTADVLKHLGCEITSSAVQNHRRNHVPR